MASAFFARPAEQKSRYAHPEWVEGYRELGPEYSQVPERPDLTESFSAWNHNRVHAELEAWRDGCPLHGALRGAADLLADVVRDLFAAMRDYFAAGSRRTCASSTPPTRSSITTNRRVIAGSCCRIRTRMATW